MFLSAKRTFNLLLHTPIIPPAPGPQAIELATIPATSAKFSTVAPPRLRTRTISNLSVRGYDPSSSYCRSVGIQKRGYAEKKGDEEAYPEEAEGAEAGVSVSSQVGDLQTYTKVIFLLFSRAMCLILMPRSTKMPIQKQLPKALSRR